MPKSQFDEKLVAASKELEDTIQKVQQFESKKEKSNTENILDALNKKVQIAGKMSSLAYTDPQPQAERGMKKKQEEWAEHHPVEAWLQNFSKGAGEKWDVLRKGTKWVGENSPFLKGLSDDALVLEGFIGAAGSAISGIAIGAMKLGYLGAELSEWSYNSIRGVETEQWKLDDIYGAGNTIKNLGQAIISWQDYPKYGKALVNSVKGYVEKTLTDPYALGGAIFDIGSCFVGVGEVNAAVKGSAAFGKFAEGTKVFQVAEKSGKIVGKLEEITALMNKLPSSMKNVVEKIKNIEIPDLSPKTSLAGVGNVGERKTLGELFSVAKSETKGKGENLRKIELGNADLENLRKKWNVPETHTIAVGETDVKGLEGIRFEGGSPKVRKEAGLPSLDEMYPNREIKAPYNRAIRGHAQFMDHAEEGIIAEFENAVKKAGLKPEGVKGTLYMHQSNPNGVCNKCTKGLFDPVPDDKRGIFKKLTDMYPNLKIKVSTEIDPSLPYPRDTLSFEVINGLTENVVKIRK